MYFLFMEFNKIIMYVLLIIMMILIITIIIIDRKARTIKNKEEEEESDFVFKVEDSSDKPNNFTELTNISEKQKAAYELNQLKEEINNKSDENIQLTNFEQKQEATAIISYDDLIKKAEGLTEEILEEEYQDEGNEPINILELSKPKEEIKTELKEVILDDFILPEEELGKKAFETESDTYKKFTSTPFISPIYGLENETEIEEQETVNITNNNYDKLDEELIKMNDFLNTLKNLSIKLNI